MEDMKRNLKITSWVILLVTALSLIKLVIEAIVTKFAVATIPDGMTREIAQVIVIGSWVLLVVSSLPEVFVGLRGLKNSEGPMAKKGHIVWAIIMTVFSGIAVVNAILTLAGGQQIGLSITEIIANVASMAIFIYYVILCKKINQGA